jgi:hypothetical protein
MKAHSSIGASSAYRWMVCPGSVKLSEGIVSTSSDYALEGTAAHQLAESCLNDEHDAAYFIGSNMVINKDGATRKVPVTQEMADAVQVYLDYVRKDEPFDTLIEHRFHLASLHPDLYGTADCAQYFEDTRTLRVTDYKHGQGLAVEAVDNPQGMYYALGALTTLMFPAQFIEIVIVQPRCPHPEGPIRSWTIGIDKLMEFQADLLDAVKRVEEAAEGYKIQTLWAETYLESGDHCRFCPAAGVPGKCKAIEAKSQALAKVEFTPLMHYDPQALAQALHDMPAVEARIKAIREFAYNEAEAGRCPPGWKLVEKRATRRWREDESVVVDRLSEHTGLVRDDMYDMPKLRSPAQLEKLIPKEERDILAELTVRESSGHTLAPADDKRVAIKQSAKEDFAALPLN